MILRVSFFVSDLTASFTAPLLRSPDLVSMVPGCGGQSVHRVGRPAENPLSRAPFVAMMQADHGTRRSRSERVGDGVAYGSKSPKHSRNISNGSYVRSDGVVAVAMCSGCREHVVADLAMLCKHMKHDTNE